MPSVNANFIESPQVFLRVRINLYMDA